MEDMRSYMITYDEEDAVSPYRCWVDIFSGSYFVLRNDNKWSMSFASVMVESHCTGMGQRPRPGTGSMGFNILYRNLHNGMRRGH